VVRWFVVRWFVGSLFVRSLVRSFSFVHGFIVSFRFVRSLFVVRCSLFVHSSIRPFVVCCSLFVRSCRFWLVGCFVDWSVVLLFVWLVGGFVVAAVLCRRCASLVRLHSFVFTSFVVRRSILVCCLLLFLLFVGDRGRVARHRSRSVLCAENIYCVCNFACRASFAQNQDRFWLGVLQR